MPGLCTLDSARLVCSPDAVLRLCIDLSSEFAIHILRLRPLPELRALELDPAQVHTMALSCVSTYVHFALTSHS